jgi:hypothetical protein
MSEDKDQSSGAERSSQQQQQQHQPPQGRSGEGVASVMARLQSDNESASTPEGNGSSRG